MSSKDEEFQEIGHAGGKLEIFYEPATTTERAGLGTRFSHNGPTPCSMMQMAASLDGKILEFVPLRGMRTAPPPEPSPIVSTLLVSDREGMWGRSCPKCHGYFRTDQPGERSICPYCAHVDLCGRFTTANQRTFIDRFCRAYLEAYEGKKTVVLDLNTLADTLPENRPSWGYNEERQQNTYVCRDKKCGTHYDVLGEYACCPACGLRNSMNVFEAHIAELQRITTDAKEPREADTVVDWEKLARCFSDFEAMAKDVQGQLALFPATPRRRREIESLGFQRLIQARDNLQAWFGIDLFADISQADVTFLVKMLKQRHVFVHNGGRVDQDYLDQTKDTTVRLHQQLEVHYSEIAQLLPLLQKCASNLFAGFESIGPSRTRQGQAEHPRP